MLEVRLALMAQADNSTMLAANWVAQTSRGQGGGGTGRAERAMIHCLWLHLSLSSYFLVLVMH